MIPLLAALLLSGAALALNGWLLAFEPAANLLVPTPSRVVQSFVGALAARRPESAAQHLASATRDARATSHRVRFEDADTRRDGDTAEVIARLSTPRGDVIERRFQLTRDRDSRLWKISDFDLPD